MCDNLVIHYMFNIALICTCFNRVKLTKKSLNSISKVLKNTKKINKFHFFILDDNSTDQTNKFLTNFKNTSVFPSPLPAHAIFQDSKLILFGKLKRLPSLISFIDFNEVTTITYKGVI